MSAALHPLFDFRKNPRAAWVGLALVAVALAVLPFALAGIGTAWVRITNLAILFVLLSLGLNIVVGFAGPARPRLHRVLRGRRLHLRAAREPALQPAPAVLGDPAHRRGGRVLLRRAAGRADAEAARRLPRHRHAGLRRDRPHLPQQPVAADQPHQRAAGHHADRPVLASAASTSRRPRPSPASTSPGRSSTTTCWCWCWSSSSSSTCGCRTRASAAPGRRSARTRSPPARWASTPAT